MRHLHRILAWAKSLMFIDPHLDPSAERYADFQKLVETAKKQRPLIEFHRVCYDGGGPNRTFPTRAEFENRFGKLDGQLKRDGLSAELFVWDDFHDRYLQSDRDSPSQRVRHIKGFWFDDDLDKTISGGSG